MYNSKRGKQSLVLDTSDDNSSRHTRRESETHTQENCFLPFDNPYTLCYKPVLKRAIVSQVASAGIVSVALLEGTFDPQELKHSFSVYSGFGALSVPHLPQKNYHSVFHCVLR